MNARSWLNDVREHADPHLTCILVGNKLDLVDSPGGGPLARHREVTTEEGELYAKEEGLLFVEASAKSGVNVEKAFETAARDILDKIRRGVFDDDRVNWWLILLSFNLLTRAILSHPASSFRSP
jgi:Ras-related protein Rab-2A